MVAIYVMWNCRSGLESLLRSWARKEELFEEVTLARQEVTKALQICKNQYTQGDRSARRR